MSGAKVLHKSNVVRVHGRAVWAKVRLEGADGGRRRARKAIGGVGARRARKAKGVVGARRLEGRIGQAPEAGVGVAVAEEA